MFWNWRQAVSIVKGPHSTPSTLENKCIIKGSYRAGWVPSPTSMLIEVFIFYVEESARKDKNVSGEHRKNGGGERTLCKAAE